MGGSFLNETPLTDSGGIPLPPAPGPDAGSHWVSPGGETKSGCAPASGGIAPVVVDGGAGVPGGFRFTRLMRLRKGAEFQAVFSQKASVSDKNLVLYLKSNDLGCHRIGLCISKKVTKSAPNRTLWKRMLREAFRLDHHSWPGGYDFVVLARSMRPPTLEVLRESLGRLARRGMTRPQQGHRSPKDKKNGDSPPPVKPRPTANPPGQSPSTPGLGSD